MDDASDDRPSAGRFVGHEHRLPIRVYYEDTDAGGVVYHASYLRFMERARTEMMAALGIDLRVVQIDLGCQYVVADLAIRYRQPARLLDDLLVVSQLVELRAASVLIQQRVMRGGDVLTQADVTAAFTSLEGRPRRQPAAWLDTFERLKGIRWS
jgi:acyl-CoA thioester hydrolase